jgi:hypothetical protein
VYVVEDLIPTVEAGDTVRAGEQIATFAPPGGTGCIEIGVGNRTGARHRSRSGTAAFRTAADAPPVGPPPETT